MGKVCCFTGYRPHRFAFSADGLRPEQVQEALGAEIRRLYKEGYCTFISGMCAGVDLWAAAEVAALHRERPEVRLVGAVPFEGQDSRWSIPLQREYRRLIDACQKVEVLFDAKTAQKDAAACYRQRNRWMVDRADAVLAVYRLGSEDIRSGTAATVRYARQKQKRILYMHPETLEVMEEAVHQMQFAMD